MTATQHHFEFHEWEKAFDSFYERKQRDDTLCLVLSEGPHVSGYWIEPSSGAEPDDTTQVYNLVADVKKLERRVRNEHEETLGRRRAVMPDYDTKLKDWLS